MTRKEFSVACKIRVNTGYLLDRGEDYPSPLVAKRMQELARRQGLAVTLDEIYQNLKVDFDEPSVINRESESQAGRADSSQSSDTKAGF